MRSNWNGTKGALAGAAITPFAVGLAALSAGAGHGTYVLATLLFPYSMLLTLVTNDVITYPSVVLALVQLPIYGFAAGRSASRRQIVRAVGAMSLLHATGIALCFSGLLPNFA